MTEVILTFQTPWAFEQQWLQRLRDAVAKTFQFAVRVHVIVLKDLGTDYVMKIESKEGAPTLYANCGSVHGFEMMFTGSFLNAVVEHESKHLEIVSYLFCRLSAPNVFRRTQGEKTWQSLNQDLNALFEDCIRDVVANAFMSAESLSKYLEFELAKMTDEVKLSKCYEKRSGAAEPWPLQIIQSLRVAYLHACLEMIGQQLSALAELRTRYAGPIYDHARRAYRVIWKAAKAGQRFIDIRDETSKLSDVIFYFPKTGVGWPNPRWLKPIP